MTKKSSGRFVLRIPPELHGQLRSRALAKSISLNHLCHSLLSQSLHQAGDAGIEPLPSGAPPWLASWLRACRERWGEQLMGIVLFGSAARGEMRESSDVDLLLVLAPDAEISRKLYGDWDEATYDLVRGAPAEVNPQFVRLPLEAEDAGGLWFEVALEGAVLWEKGSEVTRILLKLRKAMAEGRISRVLSHGHPYWVKRKAG